MIKDIKIAFIGGDMRQISCASVLAEKGFEVAVFGFDRYSKDIGLCTRCDTLEDTVRKAEVIILPLPAAIDGICINSPLNDTCIPYKKVIEAADSCKILLYGSKLDDSDNLLLKKGIKVVDYYDREDFKIANAVPTAEGAVAIAINEVPFTLHGSSCLVIGYGRIGKILSRLLVSFGAKVYASARKNEDLVLAGISGSIPVKTSKISDIISDCDIIFNTVPKKILDKELLEKINTKSLIIDLASKPGGINFEHAKDIGLNTVWALSIPGKSAPVSAGKILADTIFSVLEEEGVI